MPERILVNFPTNIGDTIMALPALDQLKANYPQSRISAIASPKTKDFLGRNSFIDELLFFDKHWKFLEQINFFKALRGKYDLIIDLKHSLLPLIVPGSQRTSFIRFFHPKTHIVDKYLKLVRPFCPKSAQLKSEFKLTPAEQEKWQNFKIPKSVFIACSSSAFYKQYPYEYLKKAVIALSKEFSLVILGEVRDRDYYLSLLSLPGVIDLTGQTGIAEAAYLLKNFALTLICVDSGIMHIGSYLDIPDVVLFGPTDSINSRPRSQGSVILRNLKAKCAPCRKASCTYSGGCMNIDPDEVVQAVKKIVGK
jgi:heptosyltransferase-2